MAPQRPRNWFAAHLHTEGKEALFTTGPKTEMQDENAGGDAGGSSPRV